MIIHRMNSNGRPRCGKPSGKVSTTGVIVTCPQCLEMQKPLNREAIMQQIKEAAASFNLKHN